MRIKLGWKLGLTYLLLIALSMGAFGYFTMKFIQDSYLEQKTSALFTHASILANTSAPFLREPMISPYLKSAAREAGERVGSRFIVLAKNSKVVADSADEFNGQKLGHEEIQLALTGNNAAKPHLEEDFGWVIYLAVPVLSGKEVIGAVFMSADINALVGQLDDIRSRLFYFSLLSGAFVFFFSLFLGSFITRPVNRLINASRGIASGNYGVQVEGNKRMDELGELTRVFNEMSAKISMEDKIRKEFIANASHELKSPVAALKVLLESMPKGTLTEAEQRELTADLRFEVNRLGRLVEDLLMLSKIEGNRREINFEEVSVGELVEAVKRAISPVAQMAGKSVRTVHRGNLYWSFDGEKVFRALLNLADNAVKYSSPEGEIILGFGEAGGRLKLWVANQGPGIPLEELPRLSERFYRIDKARSRKTGGWGLGLAIVKEITEMHGGSLKVSSESNGETRFTMELPDLTIS